MSVLRLGTVVALMPAALAACADDDGAPAAPAAAKVTALSSPAAAGSGQPALSADDDGVIYLSWHEDAADSSSVLRMAVLEDSTWSQPVTIASNREFVVNWADFPSVTPLGGERLAAHWLEREGADQYAYGVRVVLSEDGGATWSRPVRPHTDSTETEHGFVSMLPAHDGVDVVWLDGREYAGERREMTLRSARVGAGGLSAAAMLDPRICDCCQTDAARADGADVVVYRDRSPEEIRDISIVRRVGGAWSEPATVHADGWHIEGCPVNGPAVAARGALVAVAWFTAARDTAKVQLAFSRDGGVSFDPPVRIDDGRPAGRVDVVLLDDTRALVSWIEEGEGGAALRVRTVGRDAGPDAALTVGPIDAARASGFPRMVASGERVILAWTDVDARVVRVSKIDLGAD